MQIDEIISRVQFVVDPATGKKAAVLIDYAAWEELLTLLQDTDEKSDHWKQAKAELDSKADDRRAEAWVTQALNAVCAEVDTSLDPAISAMQRTWLSKEDW